MGIFLAEMRGAGAEKAEAEQKLNIVGGAGGFNLAKLQYSSYAHARKIAIVTKKAGKTGGKNEGNRLLQTEAFSCKKSG